MAELDTVQYEAQFKAKKADGELRKRDVKSGEFDLAAAQSELKKWDGGGANVYVNDAKFRLAQADADLALWRERVALAEQQFNEKKTTENMLKAKRQKLEACRTQVDAIKAELKYLEEIQVPEYRKKLVRMVELNQDALEQKRIWEKTRVKHDEIELESLEKSAKTSKLVFEQQKAKYKDIQEQIKKCQIYAPTSGIVVYPVPDTIGGTGNRIIAQGEPVQYGLKILSIQDLSHMLLRIRVPEAFVAQVKVGQECEVRVDGIPGKKLKGAVKEVATMSVPLRPAPRAKMFDVVVDLTESAKELKLLPGLPADCEIRTGEPIKGVLAIPSEAIRRRPGEKPYCLLMTPRGPEERTVEPGAIDGRMVEIKSGLKAGDEVINDRRVGALK